jgi:UDP-glucuronate 4-epimerase
MAAQAGIRHSVDHPEEYVEANLVAFLNLLQACRHARVPHLTYASTSSVYGANALMPYSEHHGADHPLQFYAATKRANELMAHAYSQMFGLPTTGLRFFTVYGPWGRPDMALFRFTRAILAGEPVELYNHGNHTRDFTYIDDIVEGVVRASDAIATADPHWDPRAPDPASSAAPWRLFNIGGSNPVSIGAYVDALEAALGLPAKRVLLPRQPGDALDTHADTGELARAVGYRPGTPVAEGVRRFVEWYRAYYRV